MPLSLVPFCSYSQTNSAFLSVKFAESGPKIHLQLHKPSIIICTLAMVIPHKAEIVQIISGANHKNHLGCCYKLRSVFEGGKEVPASKEPFQEREHSSVTRGSNNYQSAL